MNKQERIHALMSLLQASLDGKEIEQSDCGHFYDSSIYHATIDNVHQFRVKPNKVTKKYRVALFKNSPSEKPTHVLDFQAFEKKWEESADFDRWLTPWTDYTVEQ